MSACGKFHLIDALVSMNGVVAACQRAGQAFIDHVTLRQVVHPEQLWETRGPSLPLRGVMRLWIGIGSLWNLDGSRRRSPTGRGPRAVHAEIPLIRKERGYYTQGFDLRFNLRQLDLF
jgi:hypothetical protein